MAHITTVCVFWRDKDVCDRLCGYNDDREWKCGACNELLVKKKATFSYLGNNVTHEVNRCPKCGKVFIPTDLAEGRMAEVEQQLEDK